MERIGVHGECKELISEMMAGNADTAGRTSLCTAFTKKQSAFPLVGRAHCAMHRVGAEKNRTYGTYRTYRDWHLAAWVPCSPELPQHMAHIPTVPLPTALRAAGLYTTRGAKGGHGGKVRFPPCSMCMAFTKKQSAFPLAGGALCAMHNVLLQHVHQREIGVIPGVGIGHCRDHLNDLAFHIAGLAPEPVFLQKTLRKGLKCRTGTQQNF